MSTDNNRFEEHVPKVDLWRDSMVGQVSEFLDKVKDLDVKGADGADTVLEETFESIADNSTDAVMNMLAICRWSCQGVTLPCYRDSER